MASSNLDVMDYKILDALQAKAKASSAQIGEMVGLSETACYNRLRRLDSMKVIRRYSAALDLKKLGCQIFFTHVTLEKDTVSDLAFFEGQVKNYPEIVECHYITGALDYLLKTVTSDFESYIKLIDTLRQANPNIRRYETLIQVKEVKGAAVPLEMIYRSRDKG
jgi:DNA-binding Lrp family transcriptional regulator